LKGKRGRGTLEFEKPPILGFLERDGRVVLKMLANVQQKTIKPLFEKFVKAGSMVNTDEYVIYDRLEAWGYGHVSVNHSAGEFARDADGDGVKYIQVKS
jgi:transposase